MDAAASAPASAATPAKTRLSLVGEEKCVSTPTAHRRRRFHRLALARLLAEAAEWRMSAEFAKKFLKRFGKRRENDRSQWEKLKMCNTPSFSGIRKNGRICTNQLGGSIAE